MLNLLFLIKLQSFKNAYLLIFFIGSLAQSGFRAFGSYFIKERPKGRGFKSLRAHNNSQKLYEKVF